MIKTLILVLLATGRLHALEFEAGDGATKGSSGSRSSEVTVPRLIDAGDVPTAYGLLKYELRADIRFYPGGGILNKLNLGIFPRFYIGAALNVTGLVNAGPVTLVREDASLLTRLIVWPEEENIPAVALGWDGPAYYASELRGLYVSLSKEIRTPLGFFQAHGGLNNSYFYEDWQSSRHLRGFAALSASFRQVTAFFEADEIGHGAGPRLNGGGRIYFEPISLGVEFRDVGATRPGQLSSRVLRVSYSGFF